MDVEEEDEHPSRINDAESRRSLGGRNTPSGKAKAADRPDTSPTGKEELWLYLVVSLCRRIPRTTTSSAAVATAADVHNEGELSLSYVNESRTNRHSRNHIFVLDAQKLILCRPIEVQSFLLMAQEKNCFSAIHILFCTFGVFLYTSCTLHPHGCNFAGKRGAASSSPRTN